MRLLVTHDPVDAYALADRVAILDAGRIVQTGTIAEVTAHPRSRYVADLVGINLVAGDVADGVLTTDRRRTRRDRRRRTRAVVRGDPPADDRRSSATRPTGTSVRNMWPGTVADIDRLGDRARVGIDGALPLTAEITTAALEPSACAPATTSTPRRRPPTSRRTRREHARSPLTGRRRGGTMS